MTQINGTLQNDASLNYLLYLPNKIAEGPMLPLILFLHGVAQRGNDLELLRPHALPELLETKSDFPFIVISPQCPEHSSWDSQTAAIIALLDEIISEYPIDQKRIYLTGISMGGYGAWDLATKYPQRFAAAVPLCGGGTPEKAESLKNLPIWAFHGAKDEIIPMEETLSMVEAIKLYQGNIKATIYPEAGHDLTDTYKDPMLYSWLLQHENSI